MAPHRCLGERMTRAVGSGAPGDDHRLWSPSLIIGQSPGSQENRFLLPVSPLWGRWRPGLSQVPGGRVLVPTGQNFRTAILDSRFSLQGPSRLKSASLADVGTLLARGLTTTKPFDFALPSACGSICFLCPALHIFHSLLLTYMFVLFCF